MPFDRGSAPGTAASRSTLRVEPQQVLRLKADLQLIRTEVEDFLLNKGRYMAMRPLGADQVSRAAADAFNENSRAALDAAFGYLGELQRVLDALDHVAATYSLVEDTITRTFRKDGP